MTPLRYTTQSTLQPLIPKQKIRFIHTAATSSCLPDYYGCVENYRKQLQQYFVVLFRPTNKQKHNYQ